MISDRTNRYDLLPGLLLPGLQSDRESNRRNQLQANVPWLVLRLKYAVPSPGSHSGPSIVPHKPIRVGIRSWQRPPGSSQGRLPLACCHARVRRERPTRYRWIATEIDIQNRFRDRIAVARNKSGFDEVVFGEVVFGEVTLSGSQLIYREKLC